jgi:hypothetical protein
MIERLRNQFNTNFSEERYAALCSSAVDVCGCPISFRIAESPIFLSREFAQRAATLAEEILERAATPEAQKIGEEAIPRDFRYADETAKPLFSAVDFAITGTSVAPELKLIELQGFPSLFHFQPTLTVLMRDAYDLDQDLVGLLPSQASYESYYDTLKTAIVGDNDPSEVALVELGPYNQKTLPDFLLAQKHLGIRIVDITSIEARGKDLYAPDPAGKLLPIRRIYNRAIRDDLVAKGSRVPFDITKEYNVTWAGHPNWYFRISKVLLPSLVGTNEAVPNAMLLSEVDPKSLDLSKYVLKPLYSFAGVGVVIGPTFEEVDGISTYARHQYLLQERVEYADVFATPEGAGVRAELRIMLLWPENEAKPTALHTLVRVTRGNKIGVDQNKGIRWVGSSAALIPGGDA